MFKLALPRHVHERVDTVGAGMSLACAVHCMLMPIVVGVLPLIGLSFLADHDIELVFVSLSVLLALLSLCFGYRTHGNARLFTLLAVSAALIVAGFLMIDSAHHIFLLSGGAFGIAVTHLLNRHLCKSCSSCCEHEGR